MQVIVPLAGRGTRFEEKGYTFPKPLIEIGNQSMIEMVLENMQLPAEAQVTFVCRSEHLGRFHLDDVLRLLVPGSRIVSLQNETAGALCSVLLAVDHLQLEGPLLIANGDQIFSSSIASYYDACRAPGVDGCILTFSATHPRWSFARTDADGRVIAVAEKRPISRQATAGFYYFRRASDLVAGAEQMILKGLRTADQFFVCPVYNELILGGKNIRTHHLPDGAMHSLGTPEDLENFIRSGGPASPCFTS
jgi:NDP-sugar pyrophosphorylase family protein